MKRISFLASEEMSFENVDRRRTMDTCIYYKLTYEPSALVSNKMKKKNYDVQKCKQVEITLVCVSIQIFMYMHTCITVISYKIFNKRILFLTLYSDNTCIDLRI